MSKNSPAGVMSASDRMMERGQKNASAAPSQQAGGAPFVAAKAGGEERRRSQRVLLRIRANVHVNLRGGQTTLEVRTLSVNPFGAMIIAPENLPAQTRLVLEHGVTAEKIACCVVRTAKEMPEGFHIPIEFDARAPKFWMIDFPPDDWRPHDDV